MGNRYRIVITLRNTNENELDDIINELTEDGREYYADEVTVELFVEDGEGNFVATSLDDES